MIHQNNSKIGQTLPDFAIAFGIFMLAVLISFSATHTLFQPYQTTQERIGEADRLANRLTYTTFTTPQEKPYVLDKDCTVSAIESFNGNNPTLYDKCQYTSNIKSITYKEYLGISDRRGVRVVIVDANGNIESLNGTTLKFGSTVPEKANTTNSYRMVYLNGNIYRLKVTAW